MARASNLDGKARADQSDIVSDAGPAPLLGKSFDLKGTASPASGQSWLDAPRLAWRAAPSRLWAWGSPVEVGAVAAREAGLDRSEYRRDEKAVADSAPAFSSFSEPADGFSPALAKRPRLDDATAVDWTGSEGKTVYIGARSYRLSFGFVGSAADPARDAAVIDPQLDVADEPASPDGSPRGFTAYRDLSAGERRAYLDWNEAGRRNPNVGAFCPLLFLHSLECALVRDGRTDISREVKNEISCLVDLHSDRVFQTHARKLLSLCDWLDPEHVPPAEYASAAGNYTDAMPHKVLHFLGWTAHKTGNLEADQALLFLMQQPGTRLDSALAQNFAQLHSFWVEAFPHHEAGAVAVPTALPRLDLTYSLIHGDFSRSYPSELPDLARMSVPDEYRRLFEQCVESVAPLDGIPVGKPRPPLVNMAMKIPESHEMPLRPGGANWLESQVAGTSPVKMRASALFAHLYEHPPLKAKNMVEVARVKQLSRDLDDLGFGFEPDPRFDLPKFRPESSISVFRSDDPFQDEDANEEFFFAQAATVVGTIGHLWFPILDVASISEIESRLPFRYRFNGAQVHRLEAVRSCVEMVEKPRAFLGSWISLLARKKDRINDIYRGFGIAFAGQRRKSHLTKFANSLHLVRPGLVKTERLLLAASELYDGRRDAERSCHDEPSGGDPSDGEAAVRGIVTQDSAPTEEGAPLPGLRQSDSFLVRAIMKRPRSRAEFGELAKARGTSVSGAADRINEWVLRNIRSAAFSDGEQIALTPLAAEWVNSLASRS